METEALSEKPCAYALERYLQGLITLEELAKKVRSWSCEVLAQYRMERRMLREANRIGGVA